MKKTVGAAALCLLFLAGAYAQQGDSLLFCGTGDVLRQRFSQNPGLEAQFNYTQALLAEQDRIAYGQGYPDMQQKSASPDYIIPIVFHIIHNNGTENISLAQIQNEMQILNNDYAKRNADTTLVDAPFQSRIGNPRIEFRLAQLDPQGNPTNGVDRIVSTLTTSASDISKLNPWPRNKYLNVWVVKSIGAGYAGYAYLPGTGAPNVDGVLIISTYIGSIGTGHAVTSRALTHEIGHFFNLLHCWGATNSPGVACGDDGISDTPLTKGWNTCPGSTASEICNSGVEENYQNYMEYSYCSRMFTTGQAMRMMLALNSTTGQRNELWTNLNLTATGVSNAQIAGIYDETDGASVFDLFPNPASSVATLEFSLKASTSVKIKVLDLPGRELFIRAEEKLHAGLHRIDIPVGEYLTPGIYLVVMEAGERRFSQRLIVR